MERAELAPALLPMRAREVEASWRRVLQGGVEKLCDVTYLWERKRQENKERDG